jgi:hypothetical protein
MKFDKHNNDWKRTVLGTINGLAITALIELSIIILLASRMVLVV